MNISLKNSGNVLFFLDFETTGFGHPREIVEVCLLAVSAVETQFFHAYVLPTKESSDSALAVHRLNKPKLRSLGANEWPEVSRAMDIFIERQVCTF